jgi:hypothetical protein
LIGLPRHLSLRANEDGVTTRPPAGSPAGGRAFFYFRDRTFVADRAFVNRGKFSETGVTQMRIQVLLASVATAVLLSCGSASAAPGAGGDTAKVQNTDHGIVLAQRGDGGGGGRAAMGGGGGGRAAMGGGGGGARFSGGGAPPRFSGRGGGARFSGEAARPRSSEAARARGDRPRRWAGGGGRYWRPGWGGGYYPYYGYGLGLGYGLGYGYGYGYPYYGGAYYDDAPVVYSGGGGGDEGYCAQRFKSYDPRSGTYLGYDGRRHPCP